ncbi:unnamed protein product [Acanthoscelides obtectus]|uniref:Uncharacterized protein n=1 Tax=Acanthoscelides obtectus TaxID=200917 RepID=A0A9P0PUL8_ACAOB|nr:unnamed protein product [Acanthoscelides obtectus]CAK1654654.1 hypothetical protein AOBTE_LOCUS18742 [Acanthoscelides obtectus]
MVERRKEWALKPRIGKTVADYFNKVYWCNECFEYKSAVPSQNLPTSVHSEKLLNQPS